MALAWNPLSCPWYAHPLPHLWKALISLPLLSGHTLTQEASGANEGVQGGHAAHTHHLPAPNASPPPQEAGQGWMGPASWARIPGGILGLQMSS